jgi:hypothetical protein
MSSSSESSLKKIAKLEEQLNKLKLSLGKSASKETKERKPRTRKDKPVSIESCKSKSELDKFTKKEIIDWIKSREIALKKANQTLKEDLVKFVWKQLKNKAESSSSEESESESGDSESDSESE